MQGVGVSQLVIHDLLLGTHAFVWLLGTRTFACRVIALSKGTCPLATQNKGTCLSPQKKRGGTCTFGTCPPSENFPLSKKLEHQRYIGVNHVLIVASGTYVRLPLVELVASANYQILFPFVLKPWGYLPLVI
jgi:hypothetical protein